MYGYDDVKGYADLKEGLKRAIKADKVSQAYIFYGSKGVGKKTLAQAFAKALNCQRASDDAQACGRCLSCLSFDSGNNPDVIYIRPEKKKSIGVDDIRQRVKTEANLKPYSFKRKIFIIEQAHTMTAQAQNALLKTLEEPPEYVVFILLCQTTDALLPTVLSRCSVIGLRGVPVNEITDYIAEKTGMPPEETAIFAEYADGSIGKAMELARSEYFSQMREEVIKLFISVEKLSLPRALALETEFEKYKDDRSFLDIAFLWYRDLLSQKFNGKIIQKDMFGEISFQAARSSVQSLILKAEAVWQAKKQLERNAGFRLVIEVMLIKLKESKNE